MYLRSQVITLLLPELIVLGGGVFCMVGGAFWRSRSAWSIVAALSVLGASLALLPTMGSFQHAAWEVTEGPFVLDHLALWGRVLALLFGFFLILVHSKRAAAIEGGELPGLLLVLTAGMSLVSWGTNLILLFLALELITIPTYVLLFLGRSAATSAESTVKYFLLSLLSTSLFLMGMAMLYGDCGSLVLSDIASAWSRATAWQPLTTVALALVGSSLAFKLAAVPFHFYAPDVYQGTTHANAGLLAVAPKIGGLVVLARVLSLREHTGGPSAWMVVLAVAMLSMTLGNLSALWQGNLRRLMAYSSIAHAGYLLIGVCAAMVVPSPASTPASFQGWSAAVLYLAAYGIAALGFFAALLEVGADGREITSVDDLRGLFRRQPLMAVALAVCLFSLSGIPPLAGFWGKLELIGSALVAATGSPNRVGSGWLLVLAIVALLNAAVAAAYYLRIVAAAFFYPDDSNAVDPKTDQPLATPASGMVTTIGAPGFAAVLAAGIMVAVGVFPGPLLKQSRWVGQSLGTVESLSRSVNRPADLQTPESVGANLDHAARAAQT